MAYKNTPKKRAAKELYIKSNFSYQMIAESFSISLKTVSNWAKEAKWVDLKASLVASPSEIAALNNAEIVRIHEDAAEQGRGLISDEIKDIHKLAQVNQYLKKEIDLTLKVEVLTAFNRWLGLADKELQHRNLEYIGAYLEEQAKK